MSTQKEKIIAIIDLLDDAQLRALYKHLLATYAEVAHKRPARKQTTESDLPGVHTPVSEDILKHFT